ncbi:hypothetical protein VTH82DRAFT_5519 [Thermothelomyces myriococcoides]
MPADPPGFFPPAHIIPPLSLPHRQSIILLHGRGFSSATFGPDITSISFPLPPSSSPSSDPISPPPAPPEVGTEVREKREEDEKGEKEDEEEREEEEKKEEERAAAARRLGTLRTAYPHARFVLPTAPRHRATIYARSLVRQWFDGWHLHDRDNEEEWRCIPGLRDTVAYVHGLVRTEAALVGGAHNVLLGGLSQGCAATLAALLLWDGDEPLAGFLGMCGWLVFERALRGALSDGTKGDGGRAGDDDDDDDDDDNDDVFDPFEREEDEENEENKGGSRRVREGQEEVSVEAKVVRTLREMLELDDDDDDDDDGKRPTSRPRAFDTPVFLGHGLDDDKVPISLGRAAAQFLKTAGMHVEWKEYHGLGHWYSPAMLLDMVSFLSHQANWDHEGNLS